mmetsp:Transcript_29751/g.74419  ORF Transcript_29751/g.74419 Transcript_29751/m.74419 type:complete len:313 (-) Transcript_29751:859-1797(-)
MASSSVDPSTSPSSSSPPSVSAELRSFSSLSAALRILGELERWSPRSMAAAQHCRSAVASSCSGNSLGHRMANQRYKSYTSCACSKTVISATVAAARKGGCSTTRTLTRPRATKQLANNSSAVSVWDVVSSTLQGAMANIHWSSSDMPRCSTSVALSTKSMESRKKKCSDTCASLWNASSAPTRLIPGRASMYSAIWSRVGDTPHCLISTTLAFSDSRSRCMSCSFRQVTPPLSLPMPKRPARPASCFISGGSSARWAMPSNLVNVAKMMRLILRLSPKPMASDAMSTSYPVVSRLLKSSACRDRASGGSLP